jgi:hypothetical protein
LLAPGYLKRTGRDLDIDLLGDIGKQAERDAAAQQGAHQRAQQLAQAGGQDSPMFLRR